MTKPSHKRIGFLVGLLIVCAAAYRWVAAPVAFDTAFDIRLENLPADLVVTGPVPTEGEARIRGPRAAVRSFRNSAGICRLDLRPAKPGLFTLPIDAAAFNLPRAISLVTVDPASITLRLEPKITRTVAVQAVLIGTPAQGYEVQQAAAHPTAVAVSGPKQIIDGLAHLPTAPVSLENKSDSFKKEIALDLPEGVMMAGDPPPSPVVVTVVTITQRMGQRHFEGIPVEARHTVYEARITPPVIAIDVKGAEKDLAGLSADSGITAFVDLKDLPPGIYVRRAKINLPIGTSLVQAAPEVFTISLK